MNLGLGHLRQEWSDQEWSLSLTKEDVPCSVHGLAGGGPDGDLEEPAHLTHYPVHGAKVEQDGHHEVEEVDDGQNLEHEHKANAAGVIDILRHSLRC